jgi:hypothetical protein
VPIKMNRRKLWMKIPKLGGKKGYYIKFTHKVLRIPMAMVMVILKGL